MSYQSPLNEPPSSEPGPGGAGVPSPDDRTWAMVAHIGQIILSFIAPLIVLLTKGNESSFVKQQSTEALNFSITIIIGYIISAVLSVILIGLLTGAVVAVASIVFAIIAGIKSYGGENYRYPINIRLVK